MKRTLYRPKFSLVGLFLLLTFPAYSQLNNKIFDQYEPYVEGDTSTVRLRVEFLQYLRNTEYFDIIEKGQTLFGVCFQPHLSYQPYKNIRIRAGIQYRQDYGRTDPVSVQPVLSVTWFKHKWRYNFGAMEGTMNYGFIEPMYNIDRAITNRIENGIQGIYTGKNFKFNNFLVWNEVTYRTTLNQERFTTGFTAEHKLLDKKGYKIFLPYQGTLAHRGGQLNSNPNPIFTRINVTAGLKLQKELNSGLKINTEHYWLGSGDFSPTITQPYKNGAASWHTLSFKYKGFEWMNNYWAGREFQTPVGTQIFLNYNFYDIYNHRRVRHLFMSRLFYTQSINKKVELDMRFEPFYDFEYKFIQYGYSFYLKFLIDKDLFKIK